MFSKKRLFDPAKTAALSEPDHLALLWLGGEVGNGLSAKAHAHLTARLLAQARHELHYTDVAPGPASAVTALLGISPFLHAFAGVPPNDVRPKWIEGYGKGLLTLLAPAVVTARAHAAAIRVTDGSVHSCKSEEVLLQGTPVTYNGDSNVGNAMSTSNLLLRRNLMFAARTIKTTMKYVALRPHWLGDPSDALPTYVGVTNAVEPLAGWTTVPAIPAADLAAVYNDHLPIAYDAVPVDAAPTPQLLRLSPRRSDDDGQRRVVLDQSLRSATTSDHDRWLAKHLDQSTDSPDIVFSHSHFRGGHAQSAGTGTRSYSGTWVVDFQGDLDLDYDFISGRPSLIEGDHVRISWQHTGSDVQFIYGRDGTCWNGGEEVTPSVYADSAPWVPMMSGIGIEGRTAHLENVENAYRDSLGS